MKLEISTKLLRDTVARLSDITGNSIQLEATMEGLTITRSTTAVRAEITISDCSVEDESVVILDYEALKNTLSRTKGETVAIAIKGDIIFVSGESSLARLQTYDDELYKPADEERSVLAVSKASEIRDQLLATVDACSTGDDFLSNICIRRIKDRLCIIGSDRKRFHLAFLDSKKDASICLPSSEARAAARILKEADGHCTILAGERSIEFKAEGISFSGQLAEVRYPDVEVVTKFETKPLATVTATELKTAVRDASGFSHGVLKTISLRFEKSRLLVIGDNNATAIFEREILCKPKCQIELFVDAAKLLNLIEASSVEDIELLHLPVHYGVAIKEKDRWLYLAGMQPEKVLENSQKKKGGEK